MLTQSVRTRSEGLGGSTSRMIRSHLGEGRPLERLAFERLPAGQQLVKDHPEGVDIGSGIEVVTAQFHLLRAHIGGRPEEHVPLR